MRVDFFKHNLNEDDEKELLSVIHSLFLTTWDTVKNFEEDCAAYTNNKYTVWVKSCTAALFLVLKYFWIWEWDEVITTPLSFIATANAIEHVWAKPVFVDVDTHTGNIDIEKIEEKITKNTKAIIPVHLYGQMVDMKKLKDIAGKHNLKVIEDSAHVVEWTRDGFHPWNLSDAACFSFYATKNITSWEWWAIVTNNEDMYDWLKKARLHGMSSNAADRYTKKYTHYDMEFLWYKYNMTNIDAALLIHQLQRVALYLEKKEHICKKYDEWFSENSYITLFQTEAGVKHSRHLYCILVNPDLRDEYLHKIQEKGIGVAVNFRPIHLMKYYREKYGYKIWDFPNAEYIWSWVIALPLYPKLTSEEWAYVISSINEVIHA